MYDLSGGLWGPSVQGEEVVEGLLVWAHFGGHWSTLLVAGTGWVFVVGTRRELGDGLRWSPFDGHDDTAAPGSSGAVEPATEGRAVERQSVTAR